MEGDSGKSTGETSLWSAARQSAKSTASQAGAAVRDVRQAVAKVPPMTACVLAFSSRYTASGRKRA